MKRFLSFAFYCHRRPDRSFYFYGHKIPICARCTGILLGYLIGIALLASFSIRSVLICLLILPTVVDGYGQLIGKWGSTNIRRLFTGIAAGVGIIYLIYFNWKYPYMLGQMTREWISGR